MCEYFITNRVGNLKKIIDHDYRLYNSFVRRLYAVNTELN